MKFIHAADIHLDSPLNGLPNYEGAPLEAVRSATREAFNNLIDFTINEEVDFLLIAGDLYDGDLEDANSGMFASKGFVRLNDAGIPVVVIRGNHDAANRVGMEVPMPPNVRILGSSEPESFELVNGDVVVHGQSFAKRDVTDDLAAHYPAPVSGKFNIGMLHTNVNGVGEHALYAPTSLTALQSHGYEYWALGHIHIRQVLSTEPYVVYPGNLQGRHIRETGPKGASLVTVEDNNVTSVEHHNLDVVRWSSIEVDAAGAASQSEVLDLIQDAISEAFSEADGRVLATRITITGQTDAHPSLAGDPNRITDSARARAEHVSLDDILVQKVKIETTPVKNAAAELEGDTALSEVLAQLADLDDETVAVISKQLDPLREKLDSAISIEIGDDLITSAEWIRQVAEGLEFEVLARITEEIEQD